MAASLIGYFCSMVTACAVFMSVMNRFPQPPTFRQPHPVAAFEHTRKVIEPDKLSSAQLLGAGQSSVRVAEAASQEPQKEKQALTRSHRPSSERRAGRL